MALEMHPLQSAEVLDHRIRRADVLKILSGSFITISLIAFLTATGIHEASEKESVDAAMVGVGIFSFAVAFSAAIAAATFNNVAISIEMAAESKGLMVSKGLIRNISPPDQPLTPNT